MYTWYFIVHYTNSIANPLTQENPLYFTYGEDDFRGATFAIVDDDEKASLRDNMEGNENSMDKKPKAKSPTATTRPTPRYENDYEELSNIWGIYFNAVNFCSIAYYIYLSMKKYLIMKNQ